jgi:hypothetical protein
MGLVGARARLGVAGRRVRGLRRAPRTRTVLARPRLRYGLGDGSATAAGAANVPRKLVSAVR